MFKKMIIRHGEKIAAAVVIVLALWIALQSLNYRSLPWQPKTLADLADSTEAVIRNNTSAHVDENLTIFDYASYAEQIKENIPVQPYRGTTAWKPVLRPDRPPRGSFEILTAEAVTGIAVRRGETFTQGSMAQGKTNERWQRPANPHNINPNNVNPNNAQGGVNPLAADAHDAASIWVNLYGTIPVQQQREIYQESFNESFEAARPEYVYYELQKAEITPHANPTNEDFAWQPIVIYPGQSVSPNGLQAGSAVEIHEDRLVPMRTLLTSPANAASGGNHPRHNLLLYSDRAVEPSKTYAYRIRLYLMNPNFNMQTSHVAEGVDTNSQYVRSNWSLFAKVYVPDQTTVRLLSVTPSDSADFPRQSVPLGAVRGTILLDYFDTALGQLQPPIEKVRMVRGMLCNTTQEELKRYLGRIGTTGTVMSAGYPDTGLQTDVCILDFYGGKHLQKRASRESQGTPDLWTPGKTLLLLPDGSMQTMTTTP